MRIEIGVDIRRYGVACVIAAAMGCAPVLAQTADADAPGDKDVPVTSFA